MRLLLLYAAVLCGCVRLAAAQQRAREVFLTYGRGTKEARGAAADFAAAAPARAFDLRLAMPSEAEVLRWRARAKGGGERERERERW